jgi:3-hydroxy-9,10-secoandrosta-1,3,5(10)-triene-9,17-dione monooxygenase
MTAPAPVSGASRQSLISLEPWIDDVSARADASRKARQLADATVADLKASGLIRAFLPKRWGGLECTPQEFFEKQIAIAERDMSAGWVTGIIAVHAFQIALMDEQAQRDVYADDPDTCVSSSYNPVGARVEQVEGGVMLSGRWGWSSGSHHCTWALLGGVIPGEGYRTFLVPQSDYRIEDTWFPMGLHATGSNDIVIDKPVFVPDYRSHKRLDGFLCRNEQDNPMYSLPWAQLFIRIVSSPAIGAAKHARQLFMDNLGASSTDLTKKASDPDILERIAKASHLIDETEAVLYRNFDAMLDKVNRGEEIPMVDRVRYRYQAALVIEKMNQAVDLLFDVAGGRSVFEGSPIQDIWLDIHIARSHVANNPVGFARNLGGVMLGMDSQDEFV